MVEANDVFEAKVQAEIEKVKDLEIRELKLKVQARGVLTSGFCEKSEFIRAYAESVVKEAGMGGLIVEDVDDGDANPLPVLAALAQTVDGDDDDSKEDIMDELPSYIKRRVDRLQELEDEREALMKQYLKERAELEAKYQSLSKPIYEKRAAVVNGTMDEEIANNNPADDSEEGEEKIKGIPQFWVCALGHMEVVASMLTEFDIGCLESLQDIRCEDKENGEGFTLYFHFAPNDYFANDVLTKSYEVPNLLMGDEPILNNVEGCEITWKPGKSLAYKETVKQQRGKGGNAGKIRTVKKSEKSESFFHFFTPPQMPSIENMNEAEATRLERAFDEDYDIAQAFRLQIIPKAVLWFTGHAMEQEMEAAMKAMKWPEGGPPGDEENPECKQS